MSNDTVYESDMFFPIVSEDLFRIEASDFVKNNKGVKTVEFVFFVNDTLEFVEAKTSSPNPDNHEDSNAGKFDAYIKEIFYKFSNSFLIYNALRIGRHGKTPVAGQLSASLQKVNLATVSYSFILVIKNHTPEWLGPISDELKKMMSPYFKCWKIQDTALKVYNEELAREAKIVL